MTHQRYPIGIRTTDNFLAVKLNLMQDSFNQFIVKSIGDNLSQCVKNQFFNFFNILTLRIS